MPTRKTSRNSNSRPTTSTSNSSTTTSTSTSSSKPTHANNAMPMVSVTRARTYIVADDASSRGNCLDSSMTTTLNRPTHEPNSEISKRKTSSNTITEHLSLVTVVSAPSVKGQSLKVNSFGQTFYVTRTDVTSTNTNNEEYNNDVNNTDSESILHPVIDNGSDSIILKPATPPIPRVNIVTAAANSAADSVTAVAVATGGCQGREPSVTVTSPAEAGTLQRALDSPSTVRSAAATARPLLGYRLQPVSGGDQQVVDPLVLMAAMRDLDEGHDWPQRLNGGASMAPECEAEEQRHVPLTTLASRRCGSPAQNGAARRDGSSKFTTDDDTNVDDVHSPTTVMDVRPDIDCHYVMHDNSSEVLAPSVVLSGPFVQPEVINQQQLFNRLKRPISGKSNGMHLVNPWKSSPRDCNQETASLGHSSSCSQVIMMSSSTDLFMNSPAEISCANLKMLSPPKSKTEVRPCEFVKSQKPLYADHSRRLPPLNNVLNGHLMKTAQIRRQTSDAEDNIIIKNLVKVLKNSAYEDIKNAVKVVEKLDCSVEVVESPMLAVEVENLGQESDNSASETEANYKQESIGSSSPETVDSFMQERTDSASAEEVMTVAKENIDSSSTVSSDTLEEEDTENLSTIKALSNVGEGEVVENPIKEMADDAEALFTMQILEHNLKHNASLIEVKETALIENAGCPDTHPSAEDQAVEDGSPLRVSFSDQLEELSSALILAAIDEATTSNETLPSLLFSTSSSCQNQTTVRCQNNSPSLNGAGSELVCHQNNQDDLFLEDEHEMRNNNIKVVPACENVGSGVKGAGAAVSEDTGKPTRRVQAAKPDEFAESSPPTETKSKGKLLSKSNIKRSKTSQKSVGVSQMSRQQFHGFKSPSSLLRLLNSKQANCAGKSTCANLNKSPEALYGPAGSPVTREKRVRPRLVAAVAVAVATPKKSDESPPHHPSMPRLPIGLDASSRSNRGMGASPLGFSSNPTMRALATGSNKSSDEDEDKDIKEGLDKICSKTLQRYLTARERHHHQTNMLLAQSKRYRVGRAGRVGIGTLSRASHGTNTEKHKLGTEKYKPGTEKYTPHAEKYKTDAEKYKLGMEKYKLGTEKNKPRTGKYKTDGQKYKLSTEKYEPHAGKYKPHAEKYKPSSEKHLHSNAFWKNGQLHVRINGTAGLVNSYKKGAKALQLIQQQDQIPLNVRITLVNDSRGANSKKAAISAAESLSTFAGRLTPRRTDTGSFVDAHSEHTQFKTKRTYLSNLPLNRLHSLDRLAGTKHGGGSRASGETHSGHFS